MDGHTLFPSRSQRAQEFDEEAVRDFLVDELGLEIPRLYRYDQGIHEIHRRLITRFGDEHFARAMGVFQSLLEGEDNANGLGDDGDLFRSWRYDYKMRKSWQENLSEPGTPKFPGMVLPAPIPLNPVARMQPYHKPLVVLEEPHSDEETSSVTMPVSNQGRALGLPIRDLPLQDITGTFSMPKRGPPESFWFSGSLSRSDSLCKKGTRGQCDVNNTIKQSVNNVNQPGFLDRVRARLPKLSKGKPIIRDDGMYTIPPTRYASKARKGLQDRPRLAHLNFDGAGDECGSEYIDDHELPPLPLNPRKPAANRSTTSTSRSTASLAQRSTPSSKSSFRNLARDLICPERLSSPVEPQVIVDPLDPPKFNPTPSMTTALEMSDPYDPTSRYRSIINTNPFIDDRDTIWPALNEEQRAHLFAHAQLLAQAEASQRRVDESSGKTTPMTHSRSDANVAFYGNHIETSEDSHSSRPLSSPADPPLRGRSGSPTKVQFVGENLREEVVVEIPQSPPKRSRSPMKKMFGENGWLGRSTSMKEKPSEQYQKTGLKHWGGKLRQRVEGLTEDVSKLRIPNPFHVEVEQETPLNKKTPISLDPPAQAKLYCEVELMICVTANNYLLQQRKEGRMSVESLTKVVEAWKNKGRPQVVEFQFDQATQRDLVLYNLKTFRFYGDRAENVITINSMMFGWKTIAKEMSVRTFCYPDSMIRKHLHDIYKILELLGAPLTTFLAFQELQVKTLNLMRDEQQKRLERSQMAFGQERVWHPPSAGSSGAQNPDSISQRFMNKDAINNTFPFQD
ncbi:hypothetical protein FGG08_003550 [Glutinoglossum americanum]|uniref:Uncharacterized protein n=1 Tax=Glutinoglossum americanum TaxID=1670608 RepID=A0A9P8I713_9PEZI|nr:hypothetical protein FGG08_003550 [Glutinoglossum americanum]